MVNNPRDFFKWSNHSTETFRWRFSPASEKGFPQRVFYPFTQEEGIYLVFAQTKQFRAARRGQQRLARPRGRAGRRADPARARLRSHADGRGGRAGAVGRDSARGAGEGGRPRHHPSRRARGAGDVQARRRHRAHGEADELLGRLHVFTQDALAPMRMDNGLSFVRDFERLLGEAFFNKVKSFTPMRTDTGDLEGGLMEYLSKLEALGGINIFFLGMGPEAGAASHLAYIKPGSGAAAGDFAGVIPISPSVSSNTTSASSRPAGATSRPGTRPSAAPRRTSSRSGRRPFSARAASYSLSWTPRPRRPSPRATGACSKRRFRATRWSRRDNSTRTRVSGSASTRTCGR